jgi:hypothetical protein
MLEYIWIAFYHNDEGCNNLWESHPCYGRCDFDLASGNGAEWCTGIRNSY